jgi:hypothetical protein
MAQRAPVPFIEIHAGVAKHGQRGGVVVILPAVKLGEIDELRNAVSATPLVA